MDGFEAVILTIITASTPLLIAAIGELVVERSGVLNLGVEGMMVMGAVCGFGAAYLSGSPMLGILAAIAAGMAMSVLFAFLTLTLVANQVATGLSLTLLGVGLSGLIGENFVGLPGAKLAQKHHGIDDQRDPQCPAPARVNRWFIGRAATTRRHSSPRQTRCDSPNEPCTNYRVKR